MSGLDPYPLKDKIALVTGSASGIGRAIAVVLARAGATLALVDREAGSLATTREIILAEGGCGEIFETDLARLDTLESLVDSILDKLKTIDILVNCAGITGQTTGLLETELENWDQVFAVNLKAPLLLMKQVGRHMIEQGGGGRIVNVTSTSAHRARLSPPAYGSSKSGLMQLTRSAAAELGSHGITVNAVAPGITRTAILESNFSDEQIEEIVKEGPLSNLVQRVSEPEDIAHAVLFLCLPASRQITAQTLHVSGGAII